MAKLFPRNEVVAKGKFPYLKVTYLYQHPPSLLHADYLYTDEHGPWVTSKLKNKQGHTT